MFICQVMGFCVAFLMEKMEMLLVYNFIKWAKRNCKLVWMWRTIRCDVWLCEDIHCNLICNLSIFCLNCGRGLTSFQPLIVADENSLNINVFQFKANSGDFSQMTNVLYDTPSISMPTTADIKETSKYRTVDVESWVGFLWVCEVKVMWSRFNVKAP